MTAAGGPDRYVARVVGDFGRRYIVAPADGRAPQAAVRRGKRDDVVIGDLVVCSGAGDSAVIEAIEPRNRLLFRSTSTRTKLLAANIDLVAIVYAPRPTFNPRFIWRALLAAGAARIGALVVLNKIDLPDAGDAAARMRAQLADQGATTVAISVRQAPGEASAALLAHCAGRATLLVGQSGMGKSSLLNLLCADARQRSQEFSARLNVGRQTTSESRWFPLAQGGALIDAPGFQNFGLDHIAVGELARQLPDFAPYVGRCRFANCAHVSEPECAVLAACADGTIGAERYAFYRDLAQELRR